MRWAVILLIVLGVIAAACAALLMATWRTSLLSAGASGPQKQVDILVAAKTLPAMSIVESDSVRKQSVSPKEAQSLGEFYTSPIQVVGRMLITAIEEGQAFSAKCFGKKDSAAELAAKIPQGKVGLPVPFKDRFAGMEGLISPGCVVDVLVTYRPEQDKEPVSETILQNIMVLAVGPYTVASSDQEANLFAQPKNRGESRMVTLAVTPEEAHVLQAAAEKGTVSLALRNPANAVVPEAKRTPDEPAAASAESPPAIAPPRVRPNWVMTVIQGDKKEQHTFPMPGGS